MQNLFEATDFPVQETLGALATVLVGLLAYRQWKRTKRSGRFIEDRQTAYNAVWQALEDIHANVRSIEDYRQDDFDASVRKTNILLMQHGLHIEEADKQLVADYMRALEAFAAVVARIPPGHPARRKLEITAPVVVMPPGYQETFERHEIAREAVVESFRHAIGGGQIW